jgi:cytochrome d ubiquinol oxidase subunit II
VTTAWFCFLAVMVAMYVVLDGFDLGVGALHLIVARDQEEREHATEMIGPVWNGNEVWLIASGGVLFLAFPAAYAAAFSGLYFGLIIVLWLLVGRGLALELRHQIDHPLWCGACDAVFSLASAGLALVFGVALGNVVRGVPLKADGYFSLPLFQTLNWYALLIGVFGLIVLCAHGAHFLAWRADGDFAARAARAARRLWPVVAVLGIVLAWPTYHVRHQMLTAFGDHPWRLVFPLLATAALVGVFVNQRRERWLPAFGASSLFIVGLLTTMAAGLYPYVLPARHGQPNGLTVDNASSSHHALSIALVWWPIGMLLAVVYFTFSYRMFFRARGGPTFGEPRV